MSEEGDSPKPSEKGDHLSPLASPPSQHQSIVGETQKWAPPLWEEVGEISLRSCSPSHLPAMGSLALKGFWRLVSTGETSDQSLFVVRPLGALRLLDGDLLLRRNLSRQTL